MLRVCAAVRQGSCEMKIYLGNNLPPCVIINMSAAQGTTSKQQHQPSTLPCYIFVLLLCSQVILLSSCNKGTVTGNYHTVIIQYHVFIFHFYHLSPHLACHFVHYSCLDTGKSSHKDSNLCARSAVLWRWLRDLIQVFPSSPLS